MRSSRKGIELKDSQRSKFKAKFGKRIEDYESIQRAIHTLSPITKRNYVQQLPVFFIYIDEDPDQVIANRQKDISSPDAFQIERYDRLVKEYVRIRSDKGLTSLTFISCIQGFFVNNGKRLRLDLGRMKLSKSRKKRKYSPTNDEVKRLMSVADSALKRFIIVLGYQHGMLPVDISNMKIGEYPSQSWTYFETSRSKTGEVCHCVSTPDGCKTLKDYMVLRKGVKGEPLFLGARGAPLDNQEISDLVREVIQKAGFGDVEGFSAKCLRDGLEDALIDAEIYVKIKEAMMGHTGDISHVYGSQRKLEERMVEAMKKVYPLICLTNDDANDGGLSKEDILTAIELIKSQQKQINELSTRLELVERGG